VKNQFKKTLTEHQCELPLSFSFIEVKTIKKRIGGKVIQSKVHQTESYRLDQFYKSLNIDVPNEHGKQ
jgi:hypothetical protein